MNKISYIIGSVLEAKPKAGKKLIIPHVCNDKGGWGAGLVVAISKKWDLPEKSYRRWAKNGYRTDRNTKDFTLGHIQLVQVEDNIYIANMIAQHDTHPYVDKENIAIPPIRYDRVRQCLNKVAIMAQKQNADIAVARIGCGLAGGTWQVIEGLIKETLITTGINTTVYTLDGDKSWHRTLKCV